MSRAVVRLWLLALAGLLLMSCGGTPPAATPEDTSAVSVLARQSPILSPLATPTAVATGVPPSLALVVLHTNDNWGETEPCG